MKEIDPSKLPKPEDISALFDSTGPKKTIEKEPHTPQHLIRRGRPPTPSAPGKRKSRSRFKHNTAGTEWRTDFSYNLGGSPRRTAAASAMLAEMLGEPSKTPAAARRFGG